MTIWFMLTLFLLVGLANLVSVPGRADEGDWLVVAIRVLFVLFFAAGIAACVAELRHRKAEQGPERSGSEV